MTTPARPVDPAREAPSHRRVRAALAFALALVVAPAACRNEAAAQLPASPSRAATSASATVSTKKRPVPLTAANAGKTARLWRAEGGSWGHAIAVSRALGRVAVSGGSETQLFELATGNPAGKISEGCGRVLHRGLGFGGGNLVLACEDKLDVIDAASRTKIKSVRIEPSKVQACAIAWPRVALAHEDGVIRIYSLDGAAERQVPVPGPPIEVTSLALSRDGERVAVGWTQGSVWWFETQKPSEPHKVAKGSSHVSAVAWSHDGALLAEGSPSFHVAVWKTGPPSANVGTFKVGSWTNGLAFTQDGTWLFHGGSDGFAVGEVGGTAAHELAGHADAIEDVAIDEAGIHVVTTDRDGHVDAWGVVP